jgi:hypothetical protein
MSAVCMSGFFIIFRNLHYIVQNFLKFQKLRTLDLLLDIIFIST